MAYLCKNSYKVLRYLTLLKNYFNFQFYCGYSSITSFKQLSTPHHLKDEENCHFWCQWNDRHLCCRCSSQSRFDLFHNLYLQIYCFLTLYLLVVTFQVFKFVLFYETQIVYQRNTIARLRSSKAMFWCKPTQRRLLKDKMESQLPWALAMI